MFNGKTVSYKRVVENYYRDFRGLKYRPDVEAMLEWTGNLIALLSTPRMLKPNIEKINIELGRGHLPSSLHSIITCAYVIPSETVDSNEDPYNLRLPDWSGAAEETLTEKTHLKSDCLVPMQWSADRFHQYHHILETDFNCVSRYTYTVNNNYIFTNFEKGCVAMSFLEIPTDEDGYPEIQDNQSLINALVYEIAWKVAQIDDQTDDIKSSTLNRIERDRDWYVAQANNSLKNAMKDEESAWLNDDRRMITNANPHDSFFRNITLPEKIRNYRG